MCSDVDDNFDAVLQRGAANAATRHLLVKSSRRSSIPFANVPPIPRPNSQTDPLNATVPPAGGARVKKPINKAKKVLIALRDY